MTYEEYEQHKRDKQRKAELTPMLFTIAWRGALIVTALLVVIH